MDPLATPPAAGATPVRGGARTINGRGGGRSQGSSADVAFFVDDPAEAVDIEVRFPYKDGGVRVVVRETNVVPNNLAADRTVTVSPPRRDDWSCKGLLAQGQSTGTHTVYPPGFEHGVSVYCDMSVVILQSTGLHFIYSHRNVFS